MKRGEIYFADLSPTIGSEINKRRPVLIVSNDANNRASSTLTVLPLTSNIERIFPFEVKLTTRMSGLPRDSKAMAQQIRTLAKTRLVGDRAGQLGNESMKDVERAVKLHLALK
ncbi:MAG: type II toxin-antitoxin system PemK/MazF family toxin [Burkholderiales bacterium]